MFALCEVQVHEGTTMRTVYEIQVKIKGEWRSIRPSGGSPYQYKTEREAHRMLLMTYPDKLRSDRLSGDETVRTYARQIVDNG